MNKNKGFTIIELIVVIAIIAVLAAIVLVNVTQYIAKGKDASIKGSMSSMATIAAAFYDGHSSNFLANGGSASSINDSAFIAGVAAVNNANGDSNDVVVRVIAGSWCVESKLNDSSAGNWCVDAQGYKGNSLHCGNATNAKCE